MSAVTGTDVLDDVVVTGTGNPCVAWRGRVDVGVDVCAAAPELVLRRSLPAQACPATTSQLNSETWPAPPVGACWV